MKIDEALYQLKQNIKMHKIEGTTSNQNEREKALLDYITNLQEENEELKAELQEANDSATWWNNRYKALVQVNKKLKVKLNCKECFSSTLPENTEFVILTKENYDRQQKDIELELIDYKSRNEKANWWLKEMLKQAKSDETKAIINGTLELLLNGGDEE